MKHFRNTVALTMVIGLCLAFICGAYAIGGAVYGSHNGYDYSFTYDGSPNFISSAITYEIEDELKLEFTTTVQFPNIGGGVTNHIGTFAFGTFYEEQIYKTYTIEQVCNELKIAWFPDTTKIKRCIYKAYIDYTLVESQIEGYPVWS